MASVLCVLCSPLCPLWRRRGDLFARGAAHARHRRRSRPPGFSRAPPPVCSSLTFLVLSSGALLIGGGALAWRAWHVADARLLAIAVVSVFVAGGALLAADAWQRAWRPSLWTTFEALARVQRRDADREGRRLPLDDEAYAVVRGRLRADAALTPSGVSLSVDVEGLEGRDGLEGQEGRDGRERAAFAPEALRRASPELADIAGERRREGFSRATGGLIVTVAGSLATDRLDEWRAGRLVRMPVQLRRPSRYLDPGVPDQERALARRGTRLVGTVKSGALVDLLERGSVLDEVMSAARAFARRAIAQSVAPWDPRSAAIVAAIVIGERAGLTQDVQRRLQEAGTYHVIAISGGNIAILAGLLLAMCRVAGWLGRGAMIAAIAALLAYARLVGDSASVDRATLMAVVYFGARAVRSAQPAAECPGRRVGGSRRRRSAVGGGPGIHPDVRRHPRDSDRRAGCHGGQSRRHEDHEARKDSLKTNSSCFFVFHRGFVKGRSCDGVRECSARCSWPRRRPRRCSFR